MPRIAVMLTLDGTPQTGLSPTIDVFRISGTPGQVVTASAMTEIGIGGYFFNFDSGAGYVGTDDYWWRVDGTATITNDSERYPNGVNFVPLPSDDNASVRVTAAGLESDAVNEVRDSILSDSTPFAGANIDAAITSRSSHSAADVDTVLTVAHGAGDWSAGFGDNITIDTQSYSLIAGERRLVSARKLVYTDNTKTVLHRTINITATYNLTNGDLTDYQETEA